MLTMDELHLKGELWLGYASFAYYVKTKYGYNLFRSGINHLLLTGEDVYFSFELTLSCPNVECGYVYVNSGDWGPLFGENFELAQILSEKCWKCKGPLPPGEKDWHCHIDPALWGIIETEIYNWKNNKTEIEKVKCLHPPKTT